MTDGLAGLEAPGDRLTGFKVERSTSLIISVRLEKLGPAKSDDSLLCKKIVEILVSKRARVSE